MSNPTTPNDGKPNPVSKQDDWWIKHIDDFDTLLILPCRNIGNNSVICKSAQATHWTLYGCYKHDGASVNEGMEPFGYFPNEVEAEQFRDQLINRHSHLKSDKLSLG
jgi:hypothetical protein